VTVPDHPATVAGAGKPAGREFIEFHFSPSPLSLPSDLLDYTIATHIFLLPSWSGISYGSNESDSGSISARGRFSSTADPPNELPNQPSIS